MKQGTLFDTRMPKKPKSSKGFFVQKEIVQYRDYGIFLPFAESWMKIPGYADAGKKTGIRNAPSPDEAVQCFITDKMPETGRRIFNQLMDYIGLHGGLSKYVCKVPDSRDLSWGDGRPITPNDELYTKVQEVAFAQEIARMRRKDDYHMFIPLSGRMLLNLRKARQKRIEENTYG